MQDANRLSWSSGGGTALTVFGLVFLLPGLAVLIGPELGLEMKSESGGPAPLGLRLILGGMFGSVGAACAFGRAGVAIDRGRDQLTRWWGLAFLPLHRKTYTLSNYGLVSLSREVRTSSNSNGGRSSYTVYPVRLRAEHGEDVTLQEPRDRMQARRRAEQVAKFLETGMADSSKGPERVRAAGTLDMCIRDQLKDSPPESPAQPRLRVGSYGREGRTAVIEAPGPNFFSAGGIMGIVVLFPALMFSGFVAMMMLPGAKPPFTYFMLAFCAFPIVFSASPLLLAWRRSAIRERITVTPDAIEIQRSGPFAGGTTRIPFEQLEEVETPMFTGAAAQRLGFAAALLKAGGVMLQTDDELVSVGAGLDPEAQDWLANLIRYVAVHGRPPEPARV